MSEPRFTIHRHVYEQMRERFPELARNPDLRSFIYSEVIAAYLNGRKARTKPRWAARETKRIKMRTRGYFLWNEAETRCYVILEKRGLRKEKRGFSVMTVLGRITEGEMAQVIKMRRVREIERRDPRARMHR